MPPTFPESRIFAVCEIFCWNYQEMFMTFCHFVWSNFWAIRIHIWRWKVKNIKIPKFCRKLPNFAMFQNKCAWNHLLGNWIALDNVIETRIFSHASAIDQRTQLARFMKRQNANICMRRANRWWSFLLSVAYSSVSVDQYHPLLQLSRSPVSSIVRLM